MSIEMILMQDVKDLGNAGQVVKVAAVNWAKVVGVSRPG